MPLLVFARSAFFILSTLWLRTRRTHLQSLFFIRMPSLVFARPAFVTLSALWLHPRRTHLQSLFSIRMPLLVFTRSAFVTLSALWYRTRRTHLESFAFSMSLHSHKSSKENFSLQAGEILFFRFAFVAILHYTHNIRFCEGFTECFFVTLLSDNPLDLRIFRFSEPDNTGCIPLLYNTLSAR